METSQQSQIATSYATRLDKTLRALQKRVAQQDALLQKLRSGTASLEPQPSDDPIAHLVQLRALKATYDSVISTEPWLPSQESPLPALLALRDTDKIIRGNRACVSMLESDLKATTLRLEKEKSDLNDAKLMQDAMHSRISTLKGTIEAQTQKTPVQLAREMIRAAQRQKDHYDTETGELIAAFNEFIDNHLAVMLAAEQLGGPVAGQDPSIIATALEGGFTSQGKVKKAAAKGNDDKRQRRIDQIWGVQIQEVPEDEEWDEKAAAGAEMRELTEQLLNALVEADGKGPSTYVQLEHDSAAARFLVRAKVAQFHPTNGTKIRLFDFGGDVNE